MKSVVMEIKSVFVEMKYVVMEVESAGHAPSAESCRVSRPKQMLVHFHFL